MATPTSIPTLSLIPERLVLLVAALATLTLLLPQAARAANWGDPIVANVPATTDASAPAPADETRALAAEAAASAPAITVEAPTSAPAPAPPPTPAEPVGLPPSSPASDDTPHMQTLPTGGMLGIERIRLPQGEHVGLIGGALLFDIGSDWGVGPGVYGSATGRRGGLFVGGVEVQKRWGLTRGLALAAGLFAGGGGGAAAPVGSGLMLRPALTLWGDLGPVLQLGLSWSSVRFPSGQIASNQIGLMLGWRQEYRYLSGSGAVFNPGSLPSAGLGFDRMLATVSTYRLSDSSSTNQTSTQTTTQARHIELIGARAERRAYAPGFTWGMEAAAAARGGAAGYMEFLGTTGFSFAPMAETLPTWRLGARFGAGVGGGGGVPTGGGLLAKAAATLEASPAPGWAVGGEYGAVRSRNGDLRAREARVWVGLDLEPGLNKRGASDTTKVVRTEWVGVVQHHTSVPRRDGTSPALDTIGLKLNRYLTEHVYVSGQAHSAFSGGAGAYSVGLVGLGLSTFPLPGKLPALRVGVEVLGGAAGGGGVATSGGAISQGLAWAAWQPQGDIGEFRLGAGATRLVHTGQSGHSGPMIELSWARAFGMVGR